MSETTDNGMRKLQPKIIPPRDAYFMGKILVEAVMCRDPVEPKAALIIDHKDRRVGFGLNFIPKDYNVTKGYGWDEQSRELALVHAEEAAIDTALKRYVPGSYTHLDVFDRHTMYVTGPPSLRGVRRAISNGLKDIIYGPLMPQYFDDVEWKETQELAKALGVKLTLCEGNMGWVRDRVLSLSHLF